VSARHRVDETSVGGGVEVKLAFEGDHHHTAVGRERYVLDGLADRHAVDDLGIFLLGIAHCVTRTGRSLSERESRRDRTRNACEPSMFHIFQVPSLEQVASLLVSEAKLRSFTELCMRMAQHSG
jgi:hypothetical protein